MVRGTLGSHVTTGNGRSLLDFSSPLVNTNLGRQYVDVMAAIASRVARPRGHRDTPTWWATPWASLPGTAHETPSHHAIATRPRPLLGGDAVGEPSPQGTTLGSVLVSTDPGPPPVAWRHACRHR